MKFVIISPRQRWGGAIALHALCKYLSESGHDARIFYCGVTRYDKDHPGRFWLQMLKYLAGDAARWVLAHLNRKLRFSAAYVHPPVPGCRRKYLPFVGEDTIVVYPESVFGNFLHAKKTVRWLLNVNPFPENTSEAYGENALFIAYRSVFNDPKLNPAGHTVEISYFDLDTYRQYNFGQRKGNCYIVRKGGNRPDLPKELDGIVIDRLSEEDIVRVFNESEYCISYDPQTSYASIAALCGCTSVVIPEPGKGRGDYLSAEDDSSGIAFGFSEEEISYAKQTRYKVRELFEDSNRQGMAEAQRFAELCEVYFAEKEMC